MGIVAALRDGKRAAELIAGEPTAFDLRCMTEALNAGAQLMTSIER